MSVSGTAFIFFLSFVYALQSESDTGTTRFDTRVCVSKVSTRHRCGTPPRQSRPSRTMCRPLGESVIGEDKGTLGHGPPPVVEGVRDTWDAGNGSGPETLLLSQSPTTRT